MRIVIAGVLGAVILLVWGFVSWTVLPWQHKRGGALPNEAAVVSALRSGVSERGVYFVPGMPRKRLTETQHEQAEESWEERHREGPLAMVVYNPKGRNPMDPRIFMSGALINFLAVVIACLLLMNTSLHGYLGRVMFVTGLGIFAGTVSDL
ncbi:MAG: hypothetical protein ACYTGC_00300, partial [Planctomycetota bacterium]